MCTGSRDQTVGNPLCSKFCCMYSLKQNQLIMGALPLADVTVHYIDIRAAGKGYDEFYEQAKGDGHHLRQGPGRRHHREAGRRTWSCATRTSITAGTLAEAEYDLVVLAVGVQPNPEAAQPFAVGSPERGRARLRVRGRRGPQPGRHQHPRRLRGGGRLRGRGTSRNRSSTAGAAVAQAAAHLERERVPA